MIYNNILEAAHNTPTIRLNKLVDEDMADIYVKFEGMNAGGSVKTRTAIYMVEAAEKEGLLDEDSIIVEPTSGNQGIGLALVGAVKGYKTVIIMPDSVSVERRKIVNQYGAEVKLVHDEGNIGEAIDKCVKLAYKMKDENPHVFMPNQFQNQNNVLTHKETTGQEILRDVDGPIDGFCSGFGTGGTITGVGQALKEANPDIWIVVAEPEKAQLIGKKPITTHYQMGIGDGVKPDIMDFDIYDDVMVVTDEEALDMSRRLASEEGILCGITSGTNVVVARNMARKLGPGKTVVTLLPDTGERYISTPLFKQDES